MRLGIDTGGTFTDFVFLGEGEGRVHKVRSTPADPLQAILAGLEEIRPEGLSGLEVVHGTTVGNQCLPGAPGRQSGAAHHPGFRRRAVHRPPDPAGAF
jgi:N-methylhydantoinase A